MEKNKLKKEILIGFLVLIAIIGGMVIFNNRNLLSPNIKNYNILTYKNTLEPISATITDNQNGNTNLLKDTVVSIDAVFKISNSNEYYSKWRTYYNDDFNVSGACNPVTSEKTTKTLTINGKRKGTFTIYSDSKCTKPVKVYETKTYTCSNCNNKRYNALDYVYFDPVNNKTCNYSNYWTQVDSNTTCYRFIILNNDDEVSKDTVKIMLDHSVGYTTYSNYLSTLKEETKNWVNHEQSKGINIVTQKEIETISKSPNERGYSNYQVSYYPPTTNLTNGYAYFDGEKIEAGISPLRTNTFIYVNGKYMHEEGIWTSSSYNDTYAYVISHTGENRIANKTSKRGVRPVIYVKKSKLTSTPEYDITNILQKSTVSTFNKDGSNKIMQGFTVTDTTTKELSKVVFYTMEKNNKGIITTYTKNGSKYSSNKNTTTVNDLGHGNDMTYNANKNTVLIIGPNDYYDTYEYNNNKTNITKKTSYRAKYNEAYGNERHLAIGYNKTDNVYYVDDTSFNSNRVYVTDENFNRKHSFDTAVEGIGQGFEYHNGYLYIATYEGGDCPNIYQFTCKKRDLINNITKGQSSTVHVYNVKLNADGTPTKNFGREVRTFYIQRRIGNTYSSGLELEGVAFADNSMFFGFNTGSSSLPNILIDTKIEDLVQSVDMPMNQYSVSYENSTLKISSDEQINALPGWSISAAKKQITKKYDSGQTSSNIEICDRYSNCQTIITPNIYKITYNTNGGTINKNTFTVAAGMTYGNLENPTKKGYNFKGWYLDNNYKTKIDSNTKVVLSTDHTIYAKWEQEYKDVSIDEYLKEYTIEDTYLIVPKDSIVSSFKEKDQYSVKFKTRNSTNKTTEILSTGDKIEIYKNNTKEKEFTIVIIGDTTGDGEINIADVSKLYQYVKGKLNVEECYLKAGKVIKEEEKVSIADVAKLYQYIKGKVKEL